MTTESDRQDERDRLGNDPLSTPGGVAQSESALERQSDRTEIDRVVASDTEAERRASTSVEFPSNVTRSTQDLTVGGNTKEPDDADPPDHSASRPSNAEQAVENQEQALESGEESPG